MLKIEKVQRKITKFITYKLGECALSYPKKTESYTSFCSKRCENNKIYK